MAGQLGLLLGALDEDNDGMGEVLLGVGIVEEALGSGIVLGWTLECDIAEEDILTEGGIAARLDIVGIEERGTLEGDIVEEDILTEGGIARVLDDIVGTEESVQEIPVGYSVHNSYVRAS